MSKNYAIIIQFVLPLTKFYRSGAQRNNVYKRDAFVTSWRSDSRVWQPRRHDRLSETSATLWIHCGALTNQRCSLATGCGINLGRPIFTVNHNGACVYISDYTWDRACVCYTREAPHTQSANWVSDHRYSTARFSYCSVNPLRLQ